MFRIIVQDAIKVALAPGPIVPDAEAWMARVNDAGGITWEWLTSHRKRDRWGGGGRWV